MIRLKYFFVINKKRIFPQKNMSSKPSLPPTRKPQTPKAPAPKKNQKELDSTFYRLSRGPQKNSSTLFSENKEDSYADAYYKKNPDLKEDRRPPEEKLSEISQNLGENNEIEFNEKISLLIRQKALTYIVNGEQSYEAFKCHYEIGVLYHHNERSSSAIRHLTKARQLSKDKEIADLLNEDQDLKNNLEIETAESYYDCAIATQRDKPDTPRQNLAKYVAKSENIISKINSENVENSEMKYRIDVLKARVKKYKGEHAAAKDFYAKSVPIFKEMNGGDNEEVADLIVEEAENNENVENCSSEVSQLYLEAYNIYTNLELQEKAERIKPKLPKENADDETGEVIEQKTEEANAANVEETPKKEEEENKEENFEQGEEIVPKQKVEPVTEPAKPVDEYMPVTSDGNQKFKPDEDVKDDVQEENKNQGLLKNEIVNKLVKKEEESNDQVSEEANAEHTDDGGFEMNDEDDDKKEKESNGEAVDDVVDEDNHGDDADDGFEDNYEADF